WSAFEKERHRYRENATRRIKSKVDQSSTGPLLRLTTGSRKNFMAYGKTFDDVRGFIVDDCSLFERGLTTTRTILKSSGIRRRVALSCDQGSLLHHVSELVGDELAAGIGAGRILPGRKNHIVAGRVGQGIQGTRRAGSGAVRMNPYGAEVMPEARLHEGARAVVERLAERAH